MSGLLKWLDSLSTALRSMRVFSSTEENTGVDDNGLLRSGLEPGERPGDARPQRRRARRVVDGFAVVAEAHVVR